MRTRLLSAAAIAAVLTAGVAVSFSQAGDSSSAARTVSLSIQGASCPLGCGSAVTAAIKKYDGVEKFELDKNKWVAKLTFKPEQDPAKFVKYFNEKTRFTCKKIEAKETTPKS